MPALFTSARERRHGASTVENRRTTSGSDATSAWIAIAPAPHEATTDSAADSFDTYTTATAQPRVASSRAVAAPIPRLPPVTTAVRCTRRRYGETR